MKHFYVILTALLTFGFSAHAQEENPKIYLGAGIPTGIPKTGVPIMLQVGYERGFFDVSALYLHDFIPRTLSAKKGGEEAAEEHTGSVRGLYFGPNFGGDLAPSKRFKIGVKAGMGLAVFFPHPEDPTASTKPMFNFDFFNMRISPRFYITRKTAIYAEGGIHMSGFMLYASTGLIFNM